MSLILPDPNPCEYCPRCGDCGYCDKGDAWDRRQEAYRAQARHMAREIVALRSDYGTLSALEFKEKYGFKEVHNFEKSLFAWLRQEGVLDAE
jgi:hypothetical protein